MTGISTSNDGAMGGFYEWVGEGFCKSSKGVGERKFLKGIPVKYDISFLRSDGKVLGTWGK